jgi:IMP dehydrogenase
MTHILDSELLSADDVLLVPSLGLLDSRSQAELGPFLYSAPMDTVTGYDLTEQLVALGHVAVVCRNLPTEELLRCINDFASNPNVFFAISLDREWLKLFMEALLATGTEEPVNVAIDIAHGDMLKAHELAIFLREAGFCRYIMSGSICTPAGASRAITAGCTHLRIGVGPGGMCTTRVKTGVGFPQLSAVYHIHRHLQNEGQRSAVLIADGGVRQPGDVVKYLSAGADAVMMGSRFSRAIESAGWQHDGWENPPLEGLVTFPLPAPIPMYAKNLRGHASADFQKSHGKSAACPEGASTRIEWDGTELSHIVAEYEGGVASAISYLGLNSILQLGPESVTMIKVTSSTQLESMPHGV